MKNEDFKHPITRTLATLIRSICSKPDDLYVSERETDTKLFIIFEPAMNDYGVLAGTRGRQIKALKVLAFRMGQQASINVTVALNESLRGQRRLQSEVQPNPDFTCDALYDAIIPVINAAFGPGVPVETESTEESMVAYVDLPDSETVSLIAIEDLFFCVGKHNGHKVEVKMMRSMRSLE